MKKVLIGVAAVLGLVVVVVLSAPFWLPALVPVDTVKQEIAKAAREATGRELRIAGDVRLAVFPRLEVEANDVSFANAPGAREPQMAALRQLLVQLQVLPLLAGEVKVDSFILVEPVIHLEVDRQGKPNWQFDLAKTEKPAAQQQAPAGTGAGGPALSGLSLGDVRLERGRLTYTDARSGRREELSDINMKIELPDLDSPFATEGSLVWHEEKLTLTVDAGEPRRLMAGEATPLKLALASAPITLAYDGTVILAETPKVAGTVDLDVPSIRGLAAWTGNPLALEGGGLGPLEIKGKVAVAGDSYAFTEARIALDSMKANGDFSAKTGGARPYLKGRLAVDMLDLNTYLPPPAEGEARPAPGADKKGPPPEWSDEPIDLSGLKAADADFDLEVGGIRVREIKIGKGKLLVSLKNGLLGADLTELELYGGRGKAKIEVDGRGQVPAVTNTVSLQGIQAEPLLTDAAGSDRLEGTGNFDLSTATSGKSQRAMVQALNGSGAMKFTDGAIKGINLAAMARNVGSAFTDTGGSQKTDFAELSGTFKIAKGILRNDDLLMLNPLVRLTGKGEADMPKRTVNYRLRPKVVGTLEGQGGEAQKAGLAVPVIVEGPWHDLKYRPDLASIVEDVAKDPAKTLEGAKETIQQLEGGAKGGVQELLKGVTGEPKDEGGSALPDPGKTLKKLFGN